MIEDNEQSERYEEPTVPQYQIQLENLDFELKKLKGNLFILEQEHTREQIRINSKLESARRALEKPLKDLQKAQNTVSSSKDKEINKINEQMKKIDDQKQKKVEQINKLEEDLSSKYNEENERYEKMSMLDNDIYSTEIEKKKNGKRNTSFGQKNRSNLENLP
jgi:chromosome segregation ATPase